MSKKLTIKFIKEQFKKEGYKLLTKVYKNNKQKLKYVCPNNHKHNISWAMWQHGQRCAHCAGLVKLSIEVIKNGFEKEKYKLLSKEYINAHTHLDIICPNGHKYSTQWNNWQQGKRCPYCAGKIKKTIKFIKFQFEKEGYTLISKFYKNAQEKLNYICPKGHKHAITWGMWSQKNRCPSCFFINNSGENNPSWKGGISCEPYCDVWLDKEFKKSIKDRDGNICLNPDCWRNCDHLPLGLHHIDHNKKNCNPNNLITLCASCNSRANTSRKWHKNWYNTIIYRRYINRR